MELIKFLQQEIKTEETFLYELDKLTDYQKVKKGMLLFREGSKSQDVFFFEKGWARTFYEKDGKDITHFFFTEDSFLLSIQYIFLNERHFPYTETLEDCVLRVARYQDIENLLAKTPQLNQFMFKQFSNMIRMLNQKIYGLQFQTAEERYQHLLVQYPKILQHVPLGHIASYLGITQQTLSVIRRESVKK